MAIGASAALLAGCSNGNGSEDGDDPAATGDGATQNGDQAGDGDTVTLTWWHNGNNDPLLSLWQGVADTYTAENPNVVFEIEPIQNEDLRTRLQIALQSGNPPDILPQWGGGEQSTQVAADFLMPLDEHIPEAIDSLGGAVAGWQTEGVTYGLPYRLGVGGFWYRTDIFAEAGIDTPPETIDDLLTAAEAIAAAGHEPIALGAQDEWPAGWWWYYTATRACSPEVLERAGAEFDFTDDCFVEAGNALQQIIDADPFNRGFLATPAQTGATSSAALVANGLAAMELMGDWHPAVMADLAEDPDELAANLGWFPFPAIPGGQGDPAAAMGGGDGFSCAADAPVECADFLAWLVNEDNQRAYAATGAGLPTLPAAADEVEDPAMQLVLPALQNAPYVQLYLDVVLGPNIGPELNSAVYDQFAGNGTAQDVVDRLERAAEAQ